jgi:hypothetical protein
MRCSIRAYFCNRPTFNRRRTAAPSKRNGTAAVAEVFESKIFAKQCPLLNCVFGRWRRQTAAFFGHRTTPPFAALFGRRRSVCPRDFRQLSQRRLGRRFDTIEAGGTSPSAASSASASASTQSSERAALRNEDETVINEALRNERQFMVSGSKRNREGRSAALRSAMSAAAVPGASLGFGFYEGEVGDRRALQRKGLCGATALSLSLSLSLSEVGGRLWRVFNYFGKSFFAAQMQ